MAFLKRRLSIVLIAIWLVMLIIAAWMNGPGEITRRSSLTLMASVLAAFTFAATGLILSPRFRELTVASEREYRKHRTQLLMAILSGTLIVAACLFKLLFQG